MGDPSAAFTRFVTADVSTTIVATSRYGYREIDLEKAIAHVRAEEDAVYTAVLIRVAATKAEAGTGVRHLSIWIGARGRAGPLAILVEFQCQYRVFDSLSASLRFYVY